MIFTILGSLLVTLVAYIIFKYGTYIHIALIIAFKLFKAWFYRRFKSTPYRADWTTAEGPYKGKYQVKFTFPHCKTVYTLYVDYKQIKAADGSTDVTDLVRPYIYNARVTPGGLGYKKLAIFKDGTFKRYNTDDAIEF